MNNFELLGDELTFILNFLNKHPRYFSIVYITGSWASNDKEPNEESDIDIFIKGNLLHLNWTAVAKVLEVKFNRLFKRKLDVNSYNEDGRKMIPIWRNRNPKLMLSNILEENNEFRQFIKDVQKDFIRNKKRYLQIAQKLYPEANIVGVNLIGSYQRGNPREDSDIDMEVVYRNTKIDNNIVVQKLYNKIIGVGGVFDIISKKTLN